MEWFDCFHSIHLNFLNAPITSYKLILQGIIHCTIIPPMNFLFVASYVYIIAPIYGFLYHFSTFVRNSRAGCPCRRSGWTGFACRLHVPLRGIFGPDSFSVARYASIIGTESPTKWDAQPAESNFQTRPRILWFFLYLSISFYVAIRNPGTIWAPKWQKSLLL